MLRTGRLAALAVAVGLVGPVSAEPEHVLTISSWGPPTSGINASMWPQIIEMMEEATDGRVTAEIKYGLVAPPAQFDLVTDGGADLTWIFHGYNPGRFVSVQMFELPGYEADSASLSEAYWTVYQDHFADLNEHRGAKLIGLMVHGPGQLTSTEAIDGLEDVASLKIRTGGGVAGEVTGLLGATPINLPAPKAYEALSSNTADATMMTIEGRKSFGLTEVAPYMYEMLGGFYRGSFAIVMNQERFDAFPEDIRTALEGVFGGPVSRVGGAVWDAADDEGRTATLATEGNRIVVFAPEDQARFATMAETVRTNVLDAIRAAGADPEAAYADLEAQLAR